MCSHYICLMRPIRLVALHSHIKCSLQSFTSNGNILHSIIRTLLYITVFINACIYINTIHVCTHMFSTSNEPMYVFLFSAQLDIYNRKYYWKYKIVSTTVISANQSYVNNTCNLYLFYSMTHAILPPRNKTIVPFIITFISPYIDLVFIYYIICILSLSKLCIEHVYTLKLLLHLKSDQIRDLIITPT